MAGIVCAGDAVFVQQNVVTDDGDMVLARIRTWHLIRFLHIDDRGEVWLIPVNPNYQDFNPSFISPKDEFYIVGKVTNILKNSNN